MPDLIFWSAFFGVPVTFLLVTAFVFRPSARERYREAKQVIFAENPVRGRAVNARARKR